jgi:hypothetical protein
MITKEQLDSLRLDSINKHIEYIKAEKKLWDVEGGFADIILYKAFKKAKSAFHVAIQEWETAFTQYYHDHN